MSAFLLACSGSFIRAVGEEGQVARSPCLASGRSWVASAHKRTPPLPYEGRMRVRLRVFVSDRLWSNGNEEEEPR